MRDTDTLKHHAGLVDRMARANGVDLEEAVLAGALRFDQIADAVLNCAGCTNPDHCAGVLASTTALNAPPGYCRNLHLLDALKRETAE